MKHSDYVAKQMQDPEYRKAARRMWPRLFVSNVWCWICVKWGIARRWIQLPAIDISDWRGRPYIFKRWAKDDYRHDDRLFVMFFATVNFPFVEIEYQTAWFEIDDETWGEMEAKNAKWMR